VDVYVKPSSHQYWTNYNNNWKCTHKARRNWYQKNKRHKCSAEKLGTALFRQCISYEILNISPRSVSQTCFILKPRFNIRLAGQSFGKKKLPQLRHYSISFLLTPWTTYSCNTAHKPLCQLLMT